MAHIVTNAEKTSFQENGFLILRRAIEPELMQRIEEQLWSAVDVPRDDPHAWTERTDIRLDRPDEHKTGAMLELSQHENVWGVCKQFVGESVLREPSGFDVLISWPRPGTDWNVSYSGHIDGYNVQHEYHPFTIGATVYGLPVQHAGGAFTYWPGSHLPAWKHFREHGWLDDDGRDSFSGKPGLGADVGPGREFIGEPGDLLFWHNLLTHSGSHNAGSNVRFGLIARFTRTDVDSVTEDRDPDPWKYWEGLDPSA